MRSIHALLSTSKSMGFAKLNFQLVMESISYVGPDGHPMTKETSRVSHCTMTKDGYALLAMGFTGKKALTFKIA
ncbi:MAG: Rha family transcriptional regulator [Candidatus Accumulibacter phosphatis]|nr:Rha family transcriptional regulator [Candidatus Accumulibacter phosphatis]